MVQGLTKAAKRMFGNIVTKYSQSWIKDKALMKRDKVYTQCSEQSNASTPTRIRSGFLSMQIHVLTNNPSLSF